MRNPSSLPPPQPASPRIRDCAPERQREAREAAEPQSFDAVAAQLDELYRSLTHRRRKSPKAASADPLADRPWIVADLHMHTSWSFDCTVDPAELVDHAIAEGLGAIAVTDHNTFGGALETVDEARDRDLIVIPGEEIKTDEQGEVIGLFLEREIPRGMPFADTIAAIREQNGLVYLPHPFDRMHTIPDPATLHRHLADIDVLEVYNARLLFEAQNDEALRFARKYDLTMGAGSDAHVLQGVGTGAPADAPVPRSGGVPDLAAERRDSPAPEVSGVPPEPQVDGAGQGKGPLAEKGPKLRDRRRDHRRHLQAVPRQGDQGDPPPRARDRRCGRRRAGRPADRPSAGDDLPAEVRAAGARAPGGRCVPRSRRACDQTLARTAAASIPRRCSERTASRLRERTRRVCRAWLARELRIVQPRLVVVMGEDALEFLNSVEFPLSQPVPATLGELQPFTPTIEALVVPDIDLSLDEQPAKTRFWNAFKPVGPWWAELPPY